MYLPQEQAQALAADLHERAVVFVQQNVSPPLDEAKNAAARLDGMTSSAGVHTATGQLAPLVQEIDQLPPAIARAAYDPTPNPEGRVVPDSTVRALHSALKYADGMSRYGTDEANPKVKQIRALGHVLYSRLAVVDAALGTEQVNQNIVDPAVRQFGP